MSSPLPKLPASPVGQLPADPLGAPPAAPVVGRREPLRFPNLRGRFGGRGRSTRAPVRQPFAERAEARRAGVTPPRTAPIAPPQRTVVNIQHAPAPVERPQGAGAAPRRRTAAEVRQAHREAVTAFLGPQVADHPLMGSAAYRDRLARFTAAHARGHQQRAMGAALAQAQADVEEAQRANPGYTPRRPRTAGEPAPAPQPEPGIQAGMPPEVRARRAAQYQQMRGTLDALRRPPEPPPPPAPGGGQP